MTASTASSPVDELGPHPAALPKRLVAEAIGTAFLLAVVVGSGIMAKELFRDSDGLALLANAIATGGGLVALILTFGSISGAHFNPVVTIIDATSGGLRWTDVPAYIGAQLAGAIAGVFAAHAMFERAVLETSHHARAGGALLFSEFVATFGLIAVISSVARRRPEGVPYAVGAYITAAYWFTPSTSFANPAVTIARTMTDTFAGIRPADAPGFIGAQVVGAFAAAGLMRWLLSGGTR
ncbi:MAG TPA: MIP/aquaporin family protein [Kofleriaceae bacterium]|jgi:glycerol uptake facilitator-like aquaporin|nr:MIP/aquaporin family protein [Kofleriaceae bacterium]